MRKKIFQGNFKECNNGKTTNTRVSNPNTLDGNPFPGDKRPGLEPDILFYKLEDDDESDIGDESVIHIKIYKIGASTKQNLQRITIPVIK